MFVANKPDNENEYVSVFAVLDAINEFFARKYGKPMYLGVVYLHAGERAEPGQHFYFHPDADFMALPAGSRPETRILGHRSAYAAGFYVNLNVGWGYLGKTQDEALQFVALCSLALEKRGNA